jgi:transcriptional regulator with XRE-family HTH domain
MDMKMVGARLRRAREAKGLSQEDAAAATSDSKMAVRTLSRLESGKGNPTVGTLEELAKVYGTTVSSLLEDTETTTVPSVDGIFFWLERYRDLPPDHKALVATILSSDLSYLDDTPELLPVARGLLRSSEPKKQNSRPS